MAQVALRQDLLDRERRRQQVERVEALAGAAQRGGLLVAAPELGLEVGREDVVDDERRLGQRRQARGDRVQEDVVVALVHDRVVALLGREEARLAAGDDAHREVRERPHEHRVGVREEVVGDVFSAQTEATNVDFATRRNGRAIGAVDEVDDEAGFLAVVELLVATLEERGPQPVGEGFEHGGHRAVEGELHWLCRLSVGRVPVPARARYPGAVSHTVILSAARTPFGRLGGALAPRTAVQLGTVAASAALQRAEVEPGDIDYAVIGQVVQAGAGHIPSRQVTLAVGVPEEIGSDTVNKVCASGMRAVALADLMVRAGDRKLLLAGGMESMSNAPYLLLQARARATASATAS